MPRNKLIAATTMTHPITSAAPVDATGKPRIVLVHGAVMDGSTWRQVRDHLVREGYRVSIVQMPLTGFDADVAAAKRVLALQDGPVVLVGHSYGGAIISVAGVDTNVKALVYVAAVQPDVGESIAALNTRFPMASHIQEVGDGFVIVQPEALRGDVAGDLSEDDASFLAAAQVPTAASSFMAELPVAAWRQKPSHGVVATKDRTVSADLQRFMYTRSGSTITEVVSSHSVHISRPEVVAEVIMRAARG